MFVHYSGEWQEAVAQRGDITIMCAKLYGQWGPNKQN